MEQTTAASPATSPRRRGWRVGLLWLGGALLACGLAWPLGALSLDSVAVWHEHPSLGIWLPQPGQVLRKRAEGWGSTLFGEDGEVGLADARRRPEPKVLVWGDSYVEALQVDDSEKLQTLLGPALARHGRPGYLGVGLAASGRNLSDTWALLPRYEALLPGVAAHVIVIQMRDTFPDEVTQLSDPSQPPFRFRPFVPSHPGWRPWFARFELASLWVLVRDGSRALAGLRLRPGPVQAAAAGPLGADGDPLPPPAPPLAYWDRALRALRQETQRPIVFAYLPQVPRLDHGRLLTDDELAPFAGAFAERCRAHGLGFVDLGPDFAAYWRATGRVPRGFPNGHAERGHLNPEGHALVAEGLARALEGTLDALQ